MTDYKTIAELNRFIVLDKYQREWEVADSYQSEGDLERELIQDLVNQGYEFLPSLNNPAAMLANVREQLQVLNKVQFSEVEWARFVETFLDKPSDNMVEKTRKIHDDYIQKREAEIEATKAGEEKAMRKAGKGLFRLNLRYVGEEAEIVKGVLGEHPAEKVIELCKAHTTATP